MKKIVYITFIMLTIAGGYFISCQKEEKPSNTETGFTFSVNTTTLKSASARLGDARKIVLTIQNADGSPTRYSSYKVNIFSMYGSFYSDNLFLKTGSYKLTMFTLIDSSNNTIYAAPVSGSPEAAYVIHPLPITFTIDANVVNSVNVQVLSTEGKTPDDFGLVQFPFTEAKVLKIMVGVFSPDSNKFVSATISGGSSAFLSPIANNLVAIGDFNYLYYGKEMYTYRFNLDSLKKHTPEEGNVPLIIYLPRTCPNLATVTDNEGKEYPVTRIGNQIWMAENLDTRHYNNGDTISQLPLPILYPDSITEFKFQVKLSGVDYQGGGNPIRYYSWEAAIDNRGVCPSGMHIPSIEEWKTLFDFVGGLDVAGRNLEKGGLVWGDFSDIPMPLNTYCFSARPSGYIDYDYYWSDLWWRGYLLSSSVNAKGVMFHRDGNVRIVDFSKEISMPVRCVKNADE